MKLPFIKFYPRDWQADSNLRMCSLEARGLWFEMLCIMAQAPRYGYLTNGDGRTPLSDDALTRLIGCSKDDLYRCRMELDAAGVPGVDEETGAWYNRRMIRDDHKRAICSKAGRDGGGNPALSKTVQNPDIQIPDTRNHISIKATIKGDLYRSDFDAFWKAYPRKVGKKAALAAWMKAKDKPGLDAIIASVSSQARSTAWAKDGGQYIPNPATWLNQGRWDDQAIEQSGKATENAI